MNLIVSNKTNIGKYPLLCKIGGSLYDEILEFRVWTKCNSTLDLICECFLRYDDALLFHNNNKENDVYSHLVVLVRQSKYIIEDHNGNFCIDNIRYSIKNKDRIAECLPCHLINDISEYEIKKVDT